MKSNYKKLGDYIIEKVEFNEGNKYFLLQGVSNGKYFQKAKTNTIDVDLSKYRVAHFNQFVFNRATTRNGDKISIALRKSESCIVSPSYRIFEVADENVLNPDYLMMWFRRPEFDRYARFKSHGSAHEFFDMDEMCEVQLPIPSIEKQKELVAEYQTVEQRIQLNNQLCEKLEETAQTIYRHWFEDFEFPVQRHCEERGTNDEAISMVAEPQSPYNEIATLPLAMTGYKSSGGAMVYNEELGKEIPEGWKVGSLADIYNFQYGLGNNNPDNGGVYPVYGSNGIIGGYNLYNNEDAPVIGHIGINCGVLCFAFGKHYVTYNGVMCNIKDSDIKFWGYSLLQSKDLMSQTRGSSQPFVSYDMLYEISAILPPKKITQQFETISKLVFSKINYKLKQTQKLEELKSLLLGKMAVEN